MQGIDERWLALWKHTEAQGDACEVYSVLTNLYSQPHRTYHTLEHIKFCLDEFEQVRHLAINLNAVELAIWFHDAVYDTGIGGNEEKSASLARILIKHALLPDSIGQQVTKLILATKHVAIPTSPDAQLMVDIDLSILGQSPDRFDEYERQIRQEYDWVSDDKFAAGRSAILKSFLARPKVYLTQFFRDKYEMQARKNIIGSITKLFKNTEVYW